VRPIGPNDLVPGCLVTRVSQIDLIEGRQLLPVVGRGRHDGATGHGRLAGGHDFQQRTKVIGRAGDEHAWVTAALGIDPDDWLVAEVLGQVGYQAVLANGNNDVGGIEQEPIEIRPLDTAPSPLGRDRGGDDTAGFIECVVPGLHLGEIPATSTKKELSLAPGAETSDQIIELGTPVDKYHAGRQRHDRGLTTGPAVPP
jgi:hypothetical protein